MDCSYHMLHALIVEISSLFLGCGLYCSLGIMPRLSKLKPRILELKAEERALRRRSPAPPRCTPPPAPPPPREAEAAEWPDAEAWSEWRDQVGASPLQDKPPCPPCEKRVNGVLVEVDGVRVAQPPGSTRETFLSLERVSSTQATRTEAAPSSPPRRAETEAASASKRPRPCIAPMKFGFMKRPLPQASIGNRSRPRSPEASAKRPCKAYDWKASAASAPTEMGARIQRRRFQPKPIKKPAAKRALVEQAPPARRIKGQADRENPAAVEPERAEAATPQPWAYQLAQRMIKMATERPCADSEEVAAGLTLLCGYREEAAKGLSLSLHRQQWSEAERKAASAAPEMIDVGEVNQSVGLFDRAVGEVVRDLLRRGLQASVGHLPAASAPAVRWASPSCTRKRTKLLSRRRAAGAPAAAKEATGKATALREEEKANFDAATADSKTDVTARARDCTCPGTSEVKRRIKIAQKALSPTVVEWIRPSQTQCKREGCIDAVLHPEDHDKVRHRKALKACDWRLEFCCGSCSVDGSHGRLCMRTCSNCGLNAASPAAHKCKFPSTEQHAQFLRDGMPLRIGYSSSSEASNLEKCVWDSRWLHAFVSLRGAVAFELQMC